MSDNGRAVKNAPPLTLRPAVPPSPPGSAIAMKPLIERSTRAGEPGYSWDALAKEGHCFPQRCPDWSPSGIVSVQVNPLAPTKTARVIVVVCSCGVIKPVPSPV